MGWEKPSDAAAEAVLWGILETAAKNRKDEARAWLNNHMGHDVAAVKAVVNGENVGRATWVEGSEKPFVANEDQFQQFIHEHHPDELVTTVNPAFQKQFFSNLKCVGGCAITKDGEPVPGVQFRPTASFVSVRKSDEARNTVEELLTAGRLQLDGIKSIEVEQ